MSVGTESQVSIRGAQLFALRKLQLKAVVSDGVTVSGATLKAVLRTIDDHGVKCWASVATIADETCLCEKTVRRAIKTLNAMGFVSIAERPGQSSHISINWESVTTPVTVTEVSTNGTPVTVSTTLDIVSTTPVTVSTDPGNCYRRSDKNRKGNDKKRDTCADKSAAHALDEWITFWNSLKERKLVAAGTSSKPNTGVLAGWKRVQGSTTLQEILSDRQAIATAIEKSDFVRGSWFSLEKLLGGKNRDGQYIAQRLLDGGYVSSSFGKPRTANMSPGVCYSEKRSAEDGRM